MKASPLFRIWRAARRRWRLVAFAIGGAASLAGLALATFVWWAYYFPVRSTVTGAVYDGQTHGLAFPEFSMDQLGRRLHPPSAFRYAWDLPRLAEEPAKKMSVTLSRVATVREFHKRLGASVWGHGFARFADADYLVFDDDSQFHREISQRLETQARIFVADHADWNCVADHAGGWNWGDTWLELKAMLRPSEYRWESVSDKWQLELICCTPNIVSLQALADGYLGESRATTDGVEFNFVNEGGHARLFTEAELFTSNSGWEKKLSDLCMEKLKDATLVKDGTVTGFEPGELSRFIVTADGLQIYFKGERVELSLCDSMVEIPWSDLDGFIRPDGPARFLAFGSERIALTVSHRDRPL